MTTRPSGRDLSFAAQVFLGTIMGLVLPGAAARAATLAFTVNASEPVVVTGTPRIAIDVGGVTRYATYAAGSGTASLTFGYPVQAGDFDANGITLAAPVELNGGAIADLAGNPANPLTFTLPDTSSLKVQTDTAAFTISPITDANANAVSFAIAKAPVGASFTYSITSSGGAGSVTGSGTIGSSPHSVSGVDVSALPSGTLTLSVIVSTTLGGTGAARTASATPSFTGVLDGVGNAAVAFSVRRMNSAYTGPLLRVRRSSDNAVQNIGSTVAGNLDAAALATFCGSSSCFLTTWYDQSGNARDAVQASAASQPRIMNAGSQEVEGSRPALRYTAAGQLLAAPPIPGQTVEGAFNIVARVTDTTVNRHPIGDRLSTASGGRVMRVVAPGTWSGFNVGGAVVVMTGAVTQQRVVSINSFPTTIIGTLDGSVRNGSTSSVYQSSGVPFWIGGGGSGSSATGDWIGTISETTVFNFTLSTSQRQTLERNQGAYYGIAVQ